MQRAPPRWKVTLLGTGTPTSRLGRFGASTLVEAGPEKPDHVVGPPDLWLSGWIATPWASRTTPMVVYGPIGTVALTDNLTKAFATDIQIRIDDEHLPPAGVAFAAKDIAAGVVYERNGVKVSAIEVDHGEKIPSVVRLRDRVRRQESRAPGRHQIRRTDRGGCEGGQRARPRSRVDRARAVEDVPFVSRGRGHTSPEEAGRIFGSAAPKFAVYSHIVFATLQPVQDVPKDALAARTRTMYKRPFVTGRDLMSFVIGDNVVAIDSGGSEITLRGNAQ